MVLVFKVDTGTNFHFKPEFAFGTIKKLQDEIHKEHHFPIDDQVLLISGGVYLQPEMGVCKYAVINETTPIYFLSKRDIDASKCPQVTTYEDHEKSFMASNAKDLHRRYIDALDLPASLNTMAERTQLARSFKDVAEELCTICQKVVKDQHFQQQGWMAVVANVTEIADSYNKKKKDFKIFFDSYLNERKNYIKKIENFLSDMEALKEIPILEPLTEAVEQLGIALKSSTGSSGNENVGEFNKVNNLYEFLVDRVDSNGSIFKIYDECCHTLEEKDEDYIMNLYKELEDFHSVSEREVMTDIKGMSDRLSRLDAYVVNAKKFAEQQMELTQSFTQNEKSANQSKDTSVIHDFCVSHREQLSIMKKTHDELLNIKEKCVKSKRELGSNIHHALKWVLYTQNKTSDTIMKFANCETEIKETLKRLTIFEQIKSAPDVYLKCIQEVVRRRAFSQAFLASASHLACSFLTFYNDEVGRRNNFLGLIQNNFLKYLFPGIKRMPEPYGNTPPIPFDQELPKLSKEDIEQLREALPKYCDKINVPDVEAISNAFNAFKSYTSMPEEGDKIDTVMQEVCAQKPEGEIIPSAAVIKDIDRGCESETDTEEFEKVGHMDKETALPVSLVHDVGTLTEVGDRSCIPPKKPPRVFHKPQLTYPIIETNHVVRNVNLPPQRAMSLSGSNTESFTNIKNSSLESINELSSVKTFNSNTDSCFNSHHQQMHCFVASHVSYSKSLSPHTPQSPRDLQVDQFSPTSPIQGHQPNEFVNDEFYIDESLPSSLSIETGQSQGEFVRQLDTANNVVALLQDTMQSLKKENMHLKACLDAVTQIINSDFNIVRNDMAAMRQLVSCEKQSFDSECNNLVENLNLEIIKQTSKIEEHLQLDYVTRIQEYEQKFSNYELKINALEFENINLKSSLAMSKTDNNNLNDELERIMIEREAERLSYEERTCELKMQNEQIIKEITEKLNQDHKAEKEAMKSRFHMMTAATKEVPCERIDKLESIEVKKHEEIVAQLVQNSEIEKREIKEMCEIEKMEAIKQAVEEALIKSSQCGKELVDQKMTASSSSDISEKRDKIKVLRTEEEETDEQLPPGHQNIVAPKEKLTTSTIGSVLDKSTYLSLTKNNPRICYFSCHPGDLVVVLWDLKYSNYRIAQDEAHLYFLHSDSLACLGLENENKLPLPKCFVLGEVVDKEYCFAKKVGNRYHVPIKTKFFRVQVKPISKRAMSIMSQSDILSKSFNSTRASVPTSSSKQCLSEMEILKKCSDQ